MLPLRYICSETADLITNESPLVPQLHTVLSHLLTCHKRGEIFPALFLMLSALPHFYMPPRKTLGPSQFKAINKEAKNWCKYEADNLLTELMMSLAPDQNPTLQKSDMPPSSRPYSGIPSHRPAG